MSESSNPPTTKSYAEIGSQLLEQFRQSQNIRLLHEAATIWAECRSVENPSDEQQIFALNLFTLLFSISIQSRDVTLLDKAVEVGKDVLQLSFLDSKQRGVVLNNLAAVLSLLFSRTKRPSLLADAARYCEESLEILSPTDPSRPMIIMNLCSILNDRADVDGDVKHLDKATDLLRNTLELCSPGSNTYMMIIELLANILQNNFMTFKNLTSLDESTAITLQILEALPKEHPKYIKHKRSLAIIYRERSKHTRDVEFMDKSIALSRETLELVPKESPSHTILLDDLAAALRARYDMSGDDSFLKEATIAYQQVLENWTEGHPEHIRALNNVANSYLAKKEVDSLKQAKLFYTKALERCPPGYPNRVMLMDNLGTTHRDLYRITGNISLLEEALYLQKQALALSPLGHPRRGVTLTSLSTTLVEHFFRYGDMEGLDDALKYTQEALRLQPDGHPARKETLIVFASALNEQSKRLGEASGLGPGAAIIPAYHSLLAGDANSEGHKDPAALNALGSILIEQHRRNGDESLLIKAMGALDLALKAHTENDSLRQNALSNLAFSLLLYYTEHESPHIVTRVIELYNEVLEHRPTGHPRRDSTLNQLGTSYFLRFHYSHDPNDVHRALDFLLQALELRAPGHAQRFETTTNLSTLYIHPDSPVADYEAGFTYLCDGVSDPHGSPRERLDQGKALVLQAHRSVRTSLSDTKIADGLLESYRRVVALFPLVANFGLKANLRLSELRRSQDIGTYAAECALSLSKPETALELLEESRAVFWSQMLNLRTSQLAQVPREYAEKLDLLFRDLEQEVKHVELGPHNGGLVNSVLAERRKKSHEAEQLINEIRTLPGLERFLLSQPFKYLMRAAEKGPVIVLLATMFESRAVVLKDASGTVQHITLPNVSLDNLRSLSLQASKMGLQRGDNRAINISKYNRARQLASDNGYNLLASLWRDIVKPIISLIGFQKREGKERPRVHWCPTGEFAFVPLHAAGIYTGDKLESCSDYLVSSYTPTITALIKSREDLSQLRRDEVNALMVAEPCAPGFTQLDNVVKEVNKVAEMLEQSSVARVDVQIGEAASMDAVTGRLADANVVHFAAHGTQNVTAPLQSGFCLRDGLLTVSSLMRIRTKQAIFAFLSACETAKGDKDQPDQVVHLAAALLYVGFRSLVATMWTMGDDDGPLVAQRIYEALLQEEIIDLGSIPYALDAAVTELRKSGVPASRWATFVHIGA